MVELTNSQLEQISGGDKRAGEMFASFMAGAANGVIMCMETGVAIMPSYVVGCAVVGGAFGVMFPS
ncbi:Blp family class II bacteriocin [Streptococcus suis]|uniref:Blp family class II bacteriocin n=1 Tax=Streptococcus suis TaxID=1307 RepID=UPI002AACAD5B|nr:Blp family class II bacteriocin [Streptococcus suis]HEM5203020.1 Blp family class II bacteriocin [Streptococcus suis]HEM5221611.1 Blp family class II bacteriocin [Streptococcus suis]HEM5223951.1 Blp family class II bacteriocin [Streptococcus suis]HEM5255524.1 Blp family class II bacteriocin [Streptococcus suis]